MNMKRLRGLLFGMLGACCWGFSGVIINCLTNSCVVDPVWVGCMRMIVSGAVFLALALVVNRPQLLAMLKDKRAMKGVFVFAVFGMAVYQITYVLCIQIAGAAPESLIAQLFLIYIMIYTCRTNHRGPKSSEIVGAVLALVGVYCIATKGDPSTLAIGLLGLVMCLVDSVLQFIHNTAPMYALREYGSLPVNAVGAVLAAIMLLPFAHPWAASTVLSAQGWALLLASALVGAVIGYLLSMQALKDVGPLAGSLMLVFEPIASVAASVVLLGVSFTLFDFIGAAAILVMMVVMTLSSAGE